MTYGRIGLHPLDSPIVFDGAWRLLQGQRFFQDFDTPNGFVPIGLQAVFFKLLGVNWWAYRLHAGVMNGLFALTAVGVLRLAGARWWLALGYGLLSTVVFYPPMGVPYMEQHAFFFLLAAIFCTMAATKATGRKQLAWVALIPIACMLSILSKQSPGFFSIPLVFIGLISQYTKFSWRSIFLGLGLGMLGAVIVFGVFVGWWSMDWGRFWTCFWEYPSAIAAERAGAWKLAPMQSVRSFAWLPFQQLSATNFFHRHLLYLPWVGIAAEWIWRKWRRQSPPPSYPTRLLLLATALVVACSFFMHSSQNQMQNGLPLVFVAIGLGLVFWQEWWARLGEVLQWPVQRLQRGIAAVSILLFAYSTWTAIDFHLQVNAPRSVLDFDAAGGIAQLPAPQPGIDGLAYQAPFSAGLLAPGELLAWLDAHDGNFLLMGDLSCLYGLSGRPSVTPFLWMHEGLTLPKIGSAAFATTDQALLAAMERHDVRYVVYEHPGHATYMGLQLECFPMTADAVYQRHIETAHVGGFEIWLLRD